MALIRGFDVNYIFESVSRIEKRLGISDGAVDAAYLQVGDFLIRRAYYHALLFGRSRKDSNGVLPGFMVDMSIKGFLRRVKARLVAQSFTAKTTAQVIRVKNNTRAFYLDARRPFTVKMLVSQTRDVERMKNEIAVRTRVATRDAYNLHVPEILQHDMDHDPVFFCEELIRGRKPYPIRDEGVLLARLCPRLWQYYQDQGIYFKPVQDAFDATTAVEKLEQACDLIDWHEGWCEKDVFMAQATRLLQSDAYVPWSTGHGDLNYGNMIVTPDEKIYLLDWEMSTEMPCAQDLVKVMWKLPSAVAYFEAKFDALAAEEGKAPVLPFRAQLTLATLMLILRWEHIQDTFRKMDKGEKALEKALRKYFRYANAFIDEREGALV